MAGVYTLIIVVTVLVPLIINFAFLGYFYRGEKEKAMKSTFDLVNQAAIDDKFEDEDFLESLEKTHANYGISVVVMDSAANILLATAHDTDDMYLRLLDAVFGKELPGTSSDESVAGNYIIKMQEDPRLGEDYLILWGTLDNGNIIMLRSAIEGIRESTNLTNRFLIVVGVVAACCSMIASYFLTRRITRPIIQLTELSKRMTNLDFDAKYQVKKRRNEVDVLGEHMNELSETLEQTIVELKQANHELQADIAMKEEAHRRQQEFIANVSHELKTPIALIQGYAEGLNEGVSDDEESRQFYCDVIIDEAKRMNRMVMSLISLNQIESGGSDMEYEHFDLVDLIRGMIASVQILLTQNNITLTFSQDEPVLVYADEYSIEQVVSNYLSNAIHYAKNEKQITITIEQKERSVRVNVFNTGDPIPEESMTHIWDKFYKVDKARMRAYGGTGIGLSIVRAVMESMHQEYGAVNCEDGVMFWFEVES